jgi:DNA gyrase/topoisomerase IV subunit A
MELIVISKDGIVIRTRMDSIRNMGRATQGVSVINVAPGDAVASLATIDMGGGTNGGNGGGGAPRGPEGTQEPLTGLETPSEPAEKGAKRVPARKPTPIRSRQQRPKPMQARPIAKKPAAKAPAKKKPAPKGKPKRR